jgi:DNA-binding response OmpR family regulator
MRRRKRPLIFIVDDEAVVAQTLSIILRTEGYNAVWFNDPFAVLTLAQTKRPDLVISDVMMPNLSGIEAAVRITEDVLGCRVLLISGQPQTGELLRVAQDRGYSFDLQAKPIHPAELLSRVRLLVLTTARMEDQTSRKLLDRRIVANGGYLLQAGWETKSHSGLSYGDLRGTLPFRPTRRCTKNEDNACAKPTGVLEITPQFAKAGAMLDRKIS